MVLLTYKEAGARLGVSLSSIRRLIRQGELRVVDVSTGATKSRFRIRDDDLTEFIEHRTAAALTGADDALDAVS